MSGHRAALIVVSLSLPASNLAFPDDLRVSRTDDRFDPSCTTNCSLREAFYQANHAGGAQRIVLAAGTYKLTLPDPGWNYEEDPDPDEDDNQRGDLDVTGTVTLVGAGQDQTIIQGATSRLIEVLYGGTLTVQKLTLRDGLSSSTGGAIANYGTTVVQQVSFLHNRVDAGINCLGGAVANYGDLSISHALFEDNDANGDEGLVPKGGALYNQTTLMLRDSTFRNNTTTDRDANSGQGGALYNEASADVARSAFIGNKAGNLSYGYGGGNAIANRDHGHLKLTNVTLSGNVGLPGDSPDDGYTLANGFDEFGADYSAVTQLINVTIAGNTGVGVSNYGQLSIRNSLISGNTFNGVPANCVNSGNSYSARGLLLGSGSFNYDCTADVPVDDALTFTKIIYPLADNQGETQTHALRKGSPAVDAGIGSCTSADQRSLSRPRDGDGDGVKVCDLGAYERAKP